ncbi:MAG: hypothetical protein V7707_10785 [Motiliproteus sp.]
MSPSSLRIYPSRTPKIVDLGSTNALIPSVDDLSKSVTTEESQVLIQSRVDPQDSYSHQQLSANSVLLQSTELSHYLPWSWDKPLPHEAPELETWIERILSSGSMVEKLGGALVWLATRLGRSLPRIEALLINDTLDSEWQLNPEMFELVRLAPIRVNSWKPNKNQSHWLNTFSDSYRLILPDKVLDALLAGSAINQDSESLGSCWRLLANEPLERWFNRNMTGDVSRLSSGMLANALPQAVFNVSANPNLSRMVSAHPQSALPGACAYGSWDVDSIANATKLDVQVPETYLQPESRTINIIGSRLDPIEQLLIDAIAAAHSQLNDLRLGDPIAFHNAFVAYIVMALYAATGSRPVRDPFECPTHFSWMHRLVYINDKSDSGSHQGRLCPLPLKVVALVQQHYLSHLAMLAESLADIKPVLSQAIKSLSAQQPADAIPFFFLLNEHYEWTSVSNKSIEELSLFHWSLPANLFRHRLIQQLTRAGMDIEVVDGWVGHAESGTASYGDYSIRCWMDDAQKAKDIVNTVYERLGWQSVQSWRKAPTLHVPEIAQQEVPTKERSFGIRAREKNRRQTIRKARNAARLEIDLFLNGRKWTDLSSDEIDQLIKKMVVTATGMPRPHANLRYRHLKGQFEKAQNQKQIKLSIRRRFSQPQQEISLVRAGAPTALTIYQKLSKQSVCLCKGDYPTTLMPSRLSQPIALLIGAVLLSIENRLSYARLLKDLMKNQHCRLLRHKGYFYLEYAETLEAADLNAAVQRHQISPKVAAMIDRGLQRKKRIDTSQLKLPAELAGIAEILKVASPPHSPLTVDGLIGTLCEVVSQANLIELPGMVAASLSERVPPTSMSLLDWIRITTGKQVHLPGNEATQQASSTDISSVIAEKQLKYRSRVNASTLGTDALQANARAYYQSIRQTLKSYSKPKAKQCASAIDTVTQQWESKVSASVLLLGQWITYRINEGKRFRSGALAFNSVTQYFGTLAGSFQELAYDHDLLCMESDDVTDFYADLVEIKQFSHRSTPYFVGVLQDFQRWAATKGVATPNWSDLDIPTPERTVSPGMLTENEYLDALHLIMHRLDLADRDFQLFVAFVLIACYRFGLRSAEATGLKREDWCAYNDSWVVLVRDNRVRKLKSHASRRAVPLLFALHTLEQHVIEQVLGRFDALASDRPNTPLLCQGSDHRLTADAPMISPTIIEVLRHVTGNPRLVLHHCRHSFYNRVFSALSDLHFPLTDKLQAKTLDPLQVRQLILGPQSGVSRRNSMAMARLMGHAHPRTGMLNYNHLMCNWADSIVRRPPRSRMKLVSAIDVDKFSVRTPLNISLLVGRLPSYTQATNEQILKVFKLVSQGKTFSQAGRMLWLQSADVALLEGIVMRAGQRMWFSQKVAQEIRTLGTEIPFEFLSRVTSDSWCRLIEYARTVKQCSDARSVDFPNREELPYLLGPTRQLLLQYPSHFALARAVIDFYQIPATLIRVSATSTNPELHALAESYGFQALTAGQAGINDKPLRQDSLRDELRNRRSYHRDYCVLIVSRNSSETLRNSYDLSVATLALALAGLFNPP